MAEWFKAHAWKVCVLSKVPRVRIPVSPPIINVYFKLKKRYKCKRSNFMKKIVITGGLGYIGTELCKIYSGHSWNDEITVIDNFENFNKDGG